MVETTREGSGGRFHTTSSCGLFHDSGPRRRGQLVFPYLRIPAIADGFNGFVVHLANHDVMHRAVSRAPFAKLQAYRRLFEEYAFTDVKLNVGLTAMDFSRDNTSYRSQ